MKYIRGYDFIRLSFVSESAVYSRNVSVGFGQKRQQHSKYEIEKWCHWNRIRYLIHTHTVPDYYTSEIKWSNRNVISIHGCVYLFARCGMRFHGFHLFFFFLFPTTFWWGLLCVVCFLPMNLAHIIHSRKWSKFNLLVCKMCWESKNLLDNIYIYFTKSANR